MDSIPYNSYEPSPVTEQSFFRYGDSSPDLEPIMEPDFKDDLNESRYRGIKRLFNFHSWSPFYFDYTDPDLENPSISPGLTFLSQNLLSTAVTSIAYEYAGGDHFFHSRFTYKGILPVFDLSYSYGGIPTVVQYKDIPQPEEISIASNISLNTYIPLTLYSGRWISGFQPSLRISHYNDYFYYVDQANYLRGITYTEPRLYFYTYQRTALRDLQPRWGFILDLKSISSPFEKEQRGSNRAFRTTLYFPGIIRGQGIKLRGQWQRQNPERYLFGNLVSFARGYEPLIATAITKYSVDYRTPLLYPDLDILGVLYMKRFRATLFHDYLYGEEMRVIKDGSLSLQTGSYSSTGLEINLDYHVLRLLIPFSSGVRISYLNNSENFNFEFLFNIYLNRF
jgi:hypothetical protein